VSARRPVPVNQGEKTNGPIDLGAALLFGALLLAVRGQCDYLMCRYKFVAVIIEDYG
jgi:hypothetical protein